MLLLKKNEIKFPSMINVQEEGGFALMITRPEYLYDENNKIIGAVNGDIELENCKYNFNDKKVTCDFEDKGKYQLIVDVKVKGKNECVINKNTTFKSVDLYGTDFENPKKLVKTNFIAYFDRKDNKIVDFSIEAKQFVIVTNKKCKLTVSIKRAVLRKNK
ncbi:hypothetical protein LY90DRAFT_699333 [Neocallimastix californiae]|uniref:Uncharacterized protein n=1 Tax=Neocallimastix californiae TaxID=1754190 RepID=A0A1Y2ESE7_9FUNG|nr:hypothetical protein LY90DRAFT_699333 [Neocallimastix californiae]|eukprot:ORY74493.1 hypothetical protein LY90DRAFT_699333 [Neocallimastix californiae]